MMRLDPLLHHQNGRYGDFGGTYLPESLMAALQELTNAWEQAKTDVAFNAALQQLLNQYAGRPTPLTEVKHFAKIIGGPRIFLKREDLLHTGAHKINNALGQILLAKTMGKKRIIAETGAGQHGVAVAASCAHLELPCEIFMGAYDMARQAANVLRMRMMGATVTAVDEGCKSLKAAVNAALRDWSQTFADTYYCLGSALGPHPYPEMVACFQSVIGQECKSQCLEQFGRLPHAVLACIGGGSNAIGIFNAFLSEPKVRLIAVEAGGHGSALGQHAARFQTLTPGVLHGCYSYLLQNQQGQIADTASISAGLDYPAVGPQHAFLFQTQRVQYVNVSDQAVIHALTQLSRTEGIIPALESAHALAYAISIAATFDKDHYIVVNLSGRGDKDLAQLATLLANKDSQDG
jgi:tryptophan synthase beta subunit